MWYSISNRRRAPLAPLTTPTLLIWWSCVLVSCVYLQRDFAMCVCVCFLSFTAQIHYSQSTHTSMNQIRPSIIYLRLNACVCVLVMRNVCAHISYHQSLRTSIARIERCWAKSFAHKHTQIWEPIRDTARALFVDGGDDGGDGGRRRLGDSEG